MKALHITLALMTCGVLSGSAAEVRTSTPGNAAAAPAVLSERIWDQYSQLFARDFSGSERERSNERARAFAHVMATHSPIALIRLSPVQRPGLSANGRISRMRIPEHGSVAMGASLVQVIRYAYELGPEFPQNRILIPNGLGSSLYDYVDTMPKGGPEVLRRALQEQFGLIARRQASPGGESVESLIVERKREQ